MCSWLIYEMWVKLGILRRYFLQPVLHPQGGGQWVILYRLGIEQAYITDAFCAATVEGIFQTDATEGILAGREITIPEGDNEAVEKPNPHNFRLTLNLNYATMSDFTYSQNDWKNNQVSWSFTQCK